MLLANAHKDTGKPETMRFFPKDFEPTLEWSCNFAKEAFEFCKVIGGNIYFMPIRADVLSWLHKTLS